MVADIKTLFQHEIVQVAITYQLKTKIQINVVQVKE